MSVTTLPVRRSRFSQWVFLGHALEERSEYFILLGLLGAALTNLSWGLPESWPSDEVSWIVDRMLADNTTNTNWFYYPNLMMNSSYLAARFLGVPLLSTFGWDQTYVVGYTTRLVSVLYYLLTAVAISRTVSLLFDLPRAPFALFFVGTIGALNHHAHLGTVSSSLFFGIAISVYFFVRTCKTRREVDFYCSVAAASLAVGAKYNGAFLFAPVPYLWFLVFRRSSLKTWLRSMVVGTATALAIFLITTPYALLDSPGFARDVNAWLTVEGPSFGHVSLSEFTRYLGKAYVGFFTVGVLVVMIAVLSLTAAAFLLASSRGKTSDKSAESTRILLTTFLVLGLAFAAYQVVSFRVGIYQSRHYVPGAVILSAMFLASWYYWLGSMPKGNRRVRIGTTALILLISISTFADFAMHANVFAVSAKTQTLAVLEDMIRMDPGTRITALAMPTRSPFQRGVIDDSVTFLYVDDAAYDVEAWDKYLSALGDQLRGADSRYVVIEDSLFSWPVFRPRRLASDYGSRLDYPNPGQAAWEEMLRQEGYVPLTDVKTGMYQYLNGGGVKALGTRAILWVAETLTAGQWRYTAEGVREKVHLYEKASSMGAR